MMRFGLGLMSAVLATIWANVWSMAGAVTPAIASQQPAWQGSQLKAQKTNNRPSGPLKYSQATPGNERRGQKMIVNGIRVTMPWIQWQGNRQGNKSSDPPTLAISDVGLRQLGGIDLLNTEEPERQPILWRNTPLQENGQFIELPARLTGQYRYLDLQPLINEAGWLVALEGDTLRIQTRSILQISNLLLGRTLGNVFGPHDIAWADGIRWKQDYVRVGGAEFPVTQLRLDLKQTGLRLQPVWPQGDGLVGISRLGPTLEGRAAIAGINGGFFNRNNKTPLGALRSQGDWISGPILNRGAMGWNEAGQVVMDRLTLTETLRTPTDTFESIALNSGYLKAGFSRYTAAWGSTYIPLTDNEVLLYVQTESRQSHPSQSSVPLRGKVVQQMVTGKAGIGSFPLALPEGQPGYVLVARSNRSGAAKLPVGTSVELSRRWSSSGLERSPHIVGAGPLLLQNRRIVLDAKAEGFSTAFIREQAPRSAAVVFGDGSLSLVTVHERVGGRGPTLVELARLLQSLGAVQALNLDGGSSTQLLLGGQMLNRPPRSAARVHSGIGLFLR